METSRGRIIYFIENQRIKPSDFLKKTNLKKGFIDKSHQKSGASDIYLSKILECYPELSAEWLLTGKGKMLKDHDNNSLIHEKTAFKDNLIIQDAELLKKDLEVLKDTINDKIDIIDMQKDIIKNLKDEIKRLNTRIQGLNL